MSALAAVDAALARIARHDPVLNSLTDVVADRARARARAIDTEIAAGKNPSRTDALKRNGALSTTAMAARSDAGSTSRTSAPSTAPRPPAGRTGARAARASSCRIRSARPAPWCAPRDVEAHVASTGARSPVAERHVPAPRARPAGSGGAPGRRQRGSRSRISNTRAPEATARCAIPSAMPSIRTGEISLTVAVERHEVADGERAVDHLAAAHAAAPRRAPSCGRKPINGL